MTQLYVGAAKSEILLPPDVHLSGYAGRIQPALGVLDPVYVRTLVVQSGDAKLVVCSADVLGFSVADARKIRDLIASAADTTVDMVLLSATHTHAGPATQFLRRCGTVNPATIESITEAIKTTVQQAVERLTPATVAMGQGSCDQSANRRSADGPVDRRVGAWLFETLDRQPIAAVCHFGCHPVVLGPGNRYVSAEFPGYTVRELERQLGGDAVGIFLNGAAGDINPSIWSSMSSAPPTWSDPDLGVRVMAEMGQALARETIAATRKSPRLGEVVLRATSRDATLPFSPMESLDQVEGMIQQIQNVTVPVGEVLPAETTASDHVTREINAAMLEYALERQADLVRGIVYAGIVVDLTAIRLGDTVLIGIPGEVFAGTALGLKDVAGPLNLFVCGYANGNVGYLPTARDYDEPGYEVGVAHRYYGYPTAVASTTEKLLTERVRAMLQDVTE